jgi:ubiquinone/menaquinone biosynthesis C-methylase UbiE
MINKSFDNSDYWSDAWVRHIESYLTAPPRAGIWLNYYFSDPASSFLECAGGSCRDSRYLFEKSRPSVGSDFDNKTLEYVRKKFRNSTFPLQQENAFLLSFESDSKDVVFHNGFWVCFDDDEKIHELLNEQVRVSKRYVVALVHNIHNQELVSRFQLLSNEDDLYRIRFFDIDSLRRIVKKSGIKFKGMKFEKFGGSVDRLFGLEKKVPFLSPVVRWLVPRLYGFQPWRKVERIALVIELEK